MVPKPEGSWRPCGNFRRLNDCTEDDRYPLPHIQDFGANLHSRTVFLVLDLQRGYHQIPMDPKDIRKMAIITPFGLFEYLRMLFGMKDSAQAFQRLMDEIFKDLPCAFVYLDDILVANRNKEEHKQHLQEVLTRLRDNGMAIHVFKCVLGRTSVKYLGQEILAARVRPLPSKIQSIIDVPRPKTKVELQRHLGMVNFYYRFLPGIAASLSTLHSLVASVKTAKARLIWDDAEISSYEQSKTCFPPFCLLTQDPG